MTMLQWTQTSMMLAAVLLLQSFDNNGRVVAFSPRPVSLRVPYTAWSTSVSLSAVSNNDNNNSNDNDNSNNNDPSTTVSASSLPVSLQVLTTSFQQHLQKVQQLCHHVSLATAAVSATLTLAVATTMTMTMTTLTALPLPATAMESKIIGQLQGSGLVFKDTLQIESFDDPKVKGVTLYISTFQKPITERMGKGFFTDPAYASVGCAKTGAVSVADNIVKGSQGEEVFEESRSLLFKTLRVQRIYDVDKKTVVYVSFNTRFDKGDDSNKSRFKSSLCAVNLELVD